MVTAKLLLASMVMFVSSVVLGADTNGIISRVRRFTIGKRGGISHVREAFQDSRGWLIDRSIANFRKNPLTGMGFGLASDPDEVRVNVGILGVPAGAGVEKGFLVTGLLEEVGLVGSLFGLLMLVSLFSPVFRPDVPLPCVCLVLSVILTNLGESTFFSAGGGMLAWLLVGAARAMSAPASDYRSHSGRGPERRGRQLRGSV
jgi:hypothetical protein